MFVGRCMYCNLCSQACPYDCLHHTPGFDAASAVFEDLYHDYNALYEIYQFYFPERYEKEREEYIEEWGKPVEENFATLEEIASKEASSEEPQEV